MAGRSPAARSLWRVLHQNDIEGLRELLPRLESKDVGALRPLLYALRTPIAMRNEIGDALKSYGAPAIMALISSLQGTAPHWAGDILTRFGEPAVPSLVDALRSRNPQIRQWAADVLGRIEDPRAVQPLRAAASDKFPNVRFHVLRALARINPVAGSVEITNTAERDPDWGVRREAILTIAKQNPGRATDLFVRLALDPNIGRFACVELRRLGADGMTAGAR